MITVGLPNTLILAVTAALLGSAMGIVLAVAGISRTRWLRWPARVYTDVFRGLPAAATILLIGVGLAPLGMQVWGPSTRVCAGSCPRCSEANASTRIVSSASLTTASIASSPVSSTRK
ncbi:ABC transporter permease subunit [Micromonospora craniellae]|uniref:ABC transporter permease subunit n=1 Tax=Micromonospora craniellae TaxID=2294034 RepID=UPI001CC433F6|nr:ABC transporter permease subunit [Micromonospora craniellae]